MYYLTKVFLTLSIFIFIGCGDDDSPTSAAVDCTSLLQDYTTKATTYSTNFLAGTATKEECESAMAANKAWCDADCELANTPAEESQCVQEELDAGTTFCSSLP